MTSRIGAFLPWWGRIATKIVLARVPVGYRLWKRLHVFELGAMDKPTYAYGVFRRALRCSPVTQRARQFRWTGTRAG